ncbi:ABC-type oligopeptide transport system substrate-binding subunit [Rhodopirellula rubra]|uniref:ABC-type oligopeptide transport system substrate-binding subunit n=1 Tax=Aporhodopirellula rubra TaxID=980271 RepID=A0A7W5DYJ1_9BACT|nr:hypothetical protein [Aporhodopirellula rubra]MBB3206880.1 ABC-type oligopeptide transport system substrate-binding subunit [Aporhodopirellula rubra]
MVQRLRFASVLFFLCCVIVGCGNTNGVVATDEEMKAYTEKNGDLSLDPTAQTEIAE